MEHSFGTDGLSLCRALGAGPAGREMLARPVIYHTPFFRERLEVQARRNLNRSLSLLK